MPRETEHREREQLAREIAEARGLRMPEARIAAAYLLPVLVRFAHHWDAAAEAQRPRTPPTA